MDMTPTAHAIGASIFFFVYLFIHAWIDDSIDLIVEEHRYKWKRTPWWALPSKITLCLTGFSILIVAAHAWRIALE